MLTPDINTQTHTQFINLHIYLHIYANAQKGLEGSLKTDTGIYLQGETKLLRSQKGYLQHLKFRMYCINLCNLAFFLK